MAAKNYRVALVGCGRIGATLEDDPLRAKPASHVGAFRSHPQTKIIAACDSNAERLALFGKRWKVRRRFTDYKKMVADVQPDILSVATWTESHAEIVITAATSGVRGIYCEKPLAVNLTAARKMIRACKQNGTALVVGHERRWDGRYRAIRNLLQSGSLGALKSIRGMTLSGLTPKLPRATFGGGTLFHDGTHLVDLFRFLGGEVAEVMAYDERPHGPKFIERNAEAILLFKNGARGIITGAGDRRYFHFELDIQTTEARIIIDNHTVRLWRSGPSDAYSGFTELQPAPFPAPTTSTNPFIGGVAALVSEMETGEISDSSGQDGYRALEIIMAIYRSAKKDGAKVKLPLSL